MTSKLFLVFSAVALMRAPSARADEKINIQWCFATASVVCVDHEGEQSLPEYISQVFRICNSSVMAEVEAIAYEAIQRSISPGCKAGSQVATPIIWTHTTERIAGMKRAQSLQGEKSWPRKEFHLFLTSKDVGCK